MTGRRQTTECCSGATETLLMRLQMPAEEVAASFDKRRSVPVKSSCCLAPRVLLWCLW